jgi:hypothetical protein
MPVAQSPDHYINSSKGCPSITEPFPLVVFLVLCATVAVLPVVQPHSLDGNPFIIFDAICHSYYLVYLTPQLFSN